MVTMFWEGEVASSDFVNTIWHDVQVSLVKFYIVVELEERGKQDGNIFNDGLDVFPTRDTSFLSGSKGVNQSQCEQYVLEREEQSLQ